MVNPTVTVKGKLKPIHIPLNLDPALENALRIQYSIDPSVEITITLLNSIREMFVLRSEDFGGETLRSLAGIEHINNNRYSVKINDEDWSAENYRGIFDTIGEFNYILIMIDNVNNESIKNLFGSRIFYNSQIRFYIQSDSNPNNIKYYTKLCLHKNYELVLYTESNVTINSFEDMIDFNISIPNKIYLESLMNQTTTINTLEVVAPIDHLIDLTIRGNTILPVDLTPMHKYVKELILNHIPLLDFISIINLLNSKGETSQLNNITFITVNFSQNIQDLSQSTYDGVISIKFLRCYYGDNTNLVTPEDIEVLQLAKPNWIIQFNNFETSLPLNPALNSAFMDLKSKSLDVKFERMKISKKTADILAKYGAIITEE